MFFLLTYDRSAGRLLSERSFDDHAAALAERRRLERESAAQPQLEIVVLSAASASELRNTHGRYFRTLHELAQDALTPTPSPVPSS